MKIKAMLQSAALCFSLSTAAFLAVSVWQPLYGMTTENQQLEDDFEEAKIIAKQLFDDGQLSNDHKAALYGLFKQATEGDNLSPRPKGFNFIAKGKWAAWNQNKSMPKETAKLNYIELVRTLNSSH